MEQKLVNGLKDVGYKGALLGPSELEKAIEGGSKSVDYTALVTFLTSEIRPLLGIDEAVNTITSPEDSVGFIMEISSFLKELNCSYEELVQGHITERLQSKDHKILLLDYLLTELMGARILEQKKPDRKIELKLQETEEAANLKEILMNLKFPKPPANITMQQLFQKLTPTIENLKKKVSSDLVGNGAFKGTLSDAQWEVLKGVQLDLNNEYKIRREMLLTRLDVTIQSFQWSDKTKGKNDEFERIYAEKRKELKAEPGVEMADLLAARDEIAIIEKTSNSSVRKNTKSSLNKVIIGQVPDRGGRTSEQAPPPPEMPSWQQRTPGPSHNRGGGARGRQAFNRQGNRGRDSNQGDYAPGNSSNYDNYSSNQDSYDYNAPRGGNSSRHDNYSEGSASGCDNRNFDSAGSYEHNSKRARTYDSFQSNRSTYTDQYVQDDQHNQQYQRRGRGRGGQSNYNRGRRY